MDDAFHSFVARRVLSLLERTIEIKTMHLTLTLLFGNDGHQAAQHRVGLRGLVVGAVGPILDGKGTETDGIVFGKNITGLCTIGLRTTYLGYEERVVGQCILTRPGSEPRIVEVGRKTKQRGGSSMPDVLEMGQRTSSGILPGLASSAVHRRIHIDRQRIDGLHRLGHALDISGIVVGREVLVAIDIGSESLAPSRILQFFGPKRIQAGLQLGMESLTILLEKGHQFLRDGSLILLDSLGTVVASIFEHANLVLDLYHQDGSTFAIDLLQMPEPGLEGTIVGLEDILGECRSYLQRFARLGMGSRKTLVIDLEPFGRIARHRVFPCTEPQIDHAKVILACLVDDSIDQREIILPFDRLEEIPIVGHQYRIQSHTMQMSKTAGDVVGTGRCAIGCLAANNQIGSSIDHKLCRRSMLANGGRLCQDLDTDGQERYER